MCFESRNIYGLEFSRKVTLMVQIYRFQFYFQIKTSKYLRMDVI